MRPRCWRRSTRLQPRHAALPARRKALHRREPWSGRAHKAPPPDAATRPERLGEALYPSQCRIGCAFTTCPYRGLRFSILCGLPFDRAAEVMNPADRGFHAKAIACSALRPRLWLEVDGIEIAGAPKL